MKRSMRNHNVDIDLCNVLADKSQQLVECLTKSGTGLVVVKVNEE